MLRNGNFSLAFTVGLLVTWMFADCLNRTLYSQEESSENWEVGKILLREDENGKQIPTDYWPIEIRELDRRLELIRSQRLRRALNPAFLEEAIYVAFLHRDWLASDKSLWQFRCDDAQRTITVRGISFALMDARNMPENGTQLFSSNTRFGNDGSLELESASNHDSRWFGFQCIPSEIAGAKKFEMRLPPALLGRMLIACDSSLTISSPDVVVEPIDAPEKYLPANWGGLSLPSGTTSERTVSIASAASGEGPVRWWMVNLSGVSSFSLYSGTADGDDTSQVLHALSQTELRYTFDENSVSVLASFEHVGRNRQPHQIRLHPSLRLIEATSNADELSWTTIPSASDMSLIQLSMDSADETKRIELRAVAKLPIKPGEKIESSATSLPLPGIELSNSFSLRGTTTVLGSASCRVKSVDSEAEFNPSEASFSSQMAFPEEDFQESTPVMEWKCSWIGQSKPATVSIQKQNSRWSSNGLTRLAIREASIMANSNMRLIGKSLSGNKLLLPVAGYWIVDSAQIVDDKEGAFQLRLVDDANGSQRIEIGWQHLAESVEFQLELLARHPNLDSAGPLIVEQARVVLPLSGECAMNYVLEAGEGYQLRYSPRLIQMLTPKQDIPLWQQNLIDSPNPVVFKDYSGGQQLFQVVRDPVPEVDSTATLSRDGSIASAVQSKDFGGNAWIWTEKTLHRWSDTGKVVHEIQLDLQSQRRSSLCIQTPEPWQFQSATVGDRALEDVASKPGLLQIPLQDDQRIALRIRFTSQESPLVLYKKLILCGPQYDIPVLHSRRILMTSPRCLVLTAMPTRTSLTSETAYIATTSETNRSRWKPTEWLNWLCWEDPTSEKISGWTKIDLETSSSAESLRQVVRIVNRNAIIPVTWMGVAILSVLSWLLLKHSFQLWWSVLSLLIVANFLVADRLLMVSQLLLISLVFGSIWAVVGRILSRSHNPANEQSISKPGVAITALLFLMTFNMSAKAQSTIEANSEIVDEVKTFGVFIPSDADNRPVGEYAYIPKQLRDLLYSEKSSTLSQATGSILSANYSLRLRQSERDQEAVQTCTVDLRVLVNQANSEMIIPIKGEGLVWTGTPLLNGQARVWGGRNFGVASNDSGVSFRAEAAGVMELKLEFIPKVIDDGERRFRIEVDIFPVATAKLRVASVGAISNLNINALGMVQRTFLGDTVANLGPTEKLRISWSSSQRPANMASAEQTSETWLLSQADQLVAGCQLSIQRGQILPRDMDLIINGDWHPIGESWKDVDLMAVVSSGNQARTVFRVRRKDWAGDDFKIQVVLIPKQNADLSRLTAPFTMLDRVNTKATYLWWSADNNPGWVPELSESRPVREDVSSDWGDFALSPQRLGHQIFGTGVAIRQQERPLPNVPISEVNSLRLRQNETILSYVANWEPTGNLAQSLIIRIPHSLAAPELEINGAPAKYRLDADGGLMFISMKDNGIGRLGRLKIRLELPVFATQSHTVPRIGIWKTPAKKSVYEIFQGLGVKIHLVAADMSIPFEAADFSTQDAESLLEMDTKFGQFELNQSPMAENSLPVKLDVRSSIDVPSQSQVLYLEQNKEGWMATVRCTWDTQSDLPDFAFFDLPLSARDGLMAGKAAFKFMPHIDSARTNLCIPLVSEPGYPPLVEFSFPLSGPTSARSILIPAIRSHNGGQPLLVALPKSIDKQPVRWLGIGDPLDRAELSEIAEASVSEYEFYATTGKTSTLTWQSSLEESRVAEVIYTQLDISSKSQSLAAGSVHYWIDSRGQPSLRFAIPDNWTVLGVLSDGQEAQWSMTGSEVVVTPPLGSLPFQLQMIVQWSFKDANRLELPLIDNRTLTGPVVVSLPKELRWKPVSDQVSLVERPDEYLTNLWAKSVVLAAQYLPNLAESESSAWMAKWQPESVGISSMWSISDSALLANSISVDIDNNGVVTSGEFWKGLGMIVESTSEATHSAGLTVRNLDQSEMWQLSSQELAFGPADHFYEPTGNQAKISFVALTILPLLVLCPWLIGKWGGRVLTHSWVDWWMLAALLWAVVPVYLFGLIAGLVGSWQAVQQFIRRRRTATRN